MAIYLFKLVRRKIQDRRARKIILTIDETHLVPEVASAQRSQQHVREHDHQHRNSELAVPTSSVENSISAEEAARQKEEARKRNALQWKLMIGLALPNFLAAVDVTIVAPAIPLISSHFSTSNISLFLPQGTC